MKPIVTPKNIYLFLKHHFTDRPYTYPKRDEDMNIVSLGLDLEEYYLKLLKFQDIFQIDEIASVSYKNETFPIYGIDINANATIKVLIVSGTHGNEQAGVFATLELLKLFRDYSNKYRRFHIRIITPNNPISIKYFSRFNGDGIDINRDFKQKKTIETGAVIKVVEEFKPDLSITLHEALHKDGTFIYGNKLIEEQFAIKVLKQAESNDVKLATKGYFPGKLKIPGFMHLKGKPFIWVKLWSDLFDLQPFGYFTVTKGIPNITIESSWKSNNKEERINAHVQIVKSALDNFM